MTELRQRQPRILEPKYLAWLRKQSCACGCRKPPPSDAAHLRAGSIAYGKEYPGLGAKPSDSWALPLNRVCHMRQHAYGDEVGFWAAHGIPDPFGRSMRYYAAYKAECPQTTADAPKQSRPRKPKEAAKSRHEPRQRAKIAKRANPWPKGRKIPNRRK
jgi:hypothetical protein